MDTITFQIPPFAPRMRLLAVLVVGVVLQGVAVAQLSWYSISIGDTDLHLSLEQIVRMCTGLSMWLLVATVLIGLRIFSKLIVLAVALVTGHPHVKRGLFGAKLMVSWLTPARAYGYLAAMLVTAVGTLVVKPTLHHDAFVILTRGAGGFVMVAGILLVQACVYVIARDPAFAAIQGWNRAAALATPTPAAPAERPMVKSPLSPAPIGVNVDPFRAPPANEIESRLVRPTTALPEAPRVDDPHRAPPSLLR